jgi:hypothetical protein
MAAHYTENAVENALLSGLAGRDALERQYGMPELMPAYNISNRSNMQDGHVNSAYLYQLGHMTDAGDIVTALMPRNVRASVSSMEQSEIMGALHTLRDKATRVVQAMATELQSSHGNVAWLYSGFEAALVGMEPSEIKRKFASADAIALAARAVWQRMRAIIYAAGIDPELLEEDKLFTTYALLPTSAHSLIKDYFEAFRDVTMARKVAVAIKEDI